MIDAVFVVSSVSWNATFRSPIILSCTCNISSIYQSYNLIKLTSTYTRIQGVIFFAYAIFHLFSTFTLTLNFCFKLNFLLSTLHLHSHEIYFTRVFDSFIRFIKFKYFILLEKTYSTKWIFNSIATSITTAETNY